MAGQARTLGSLVAATVTASIALLAAPGGAVAVTTCELNAAVLDVTMGAAGDDATLSAPVGPITVSDQNGPVACTGAPTTTNTDSVTVHNTGGGADNVVRIAEASRFEPGANAGDESGGTPEIEISVNLNDRPGSELHVSPIATGGSFVIGTFGINTNATDTEVEPDRDIALNGVPNLRIVGNPGDDDLNAQGGAGTLGPETTGIELSGGGGDDEVIGGDGVDLVVGGEGGDTISGEGGSDNVKPGTGDDAAAGGPGTDTLSYSGDAVSGVTVDLGLPGVQDTGGAGNDSFDSVENLIGTGFADVLRGDEGPNALFGLAADDVLEGRGGVDLLDAEAGADSLDVRDGGPDTANCGTESDTVTADQAGIDMLTDCENVLFPAPPGPAPGPGGGGAGGGGDEPANDFAFGKVKRNKRKGTAKLTVEVADGPGELELAKTKKVKADDEAVEGEGATTERLAIKPKRKARKRLNKRGKARVKAQVTYAPDGGEPNTQSKKVKLVKRR